MTSIIVTPKIESSWGAALAKAFEVPSFLDLKAFLINEKKTGKKIYPSGKNIFAAFDLCPFEQTKVVILGQDPYHGPGQAHGLCFSVPNGIDVPPSLQNIFKEIQSDLNIVPAKHGDLSSWAQQGVLLLNTCLTVEAHRAGSHFGKGWEVFTDEAIRQLSVQKKGLVFLLWGKPAEAKQILIDKSKHHVLTAPHPSPLSAYRGFLGCKHFSKTNEILRRQGMQPIDWSLPSN